MSLGSSKVSIGYLGSGVGLGQKYKGVDLAPSFLRSQGLLHKFKNSKYQIFDYGDFFDENWNLDIYRQLSKVTQQSASLFRCTFIVGGDHSQSIGTIHGLKKARKDLKVIWLDAHGDMNTPTTSPTGSLHGMPLAALLGLFNFSSQQGWFEPILNPKDVAILGVRDLDKGEIEFINEIGLFTLSPKQIREKGISVAVDQVMKELEINSETPVHISFDLDCISQEFISATGVPVAKGLTPIEVVEILDVLRWKSDIVSMEIVELNPYLTQSKEELQFWSSYIGDVFELVLKSKHQIQNTITQLSN